MIKPTDLLNRQAGVHQPRPFDYNDPSELAPVAEPGDEDPTAVADPLEHAEVEQTPEDVDDVDT